MKKGALFEAQVVAWLREHGFPHAERRVMGGANDRGDVAGITDRDGDAWVLELKNCQRMELATWWAELAKEKVNAGVMHGALIHKRRGKGAVEDQWVTMDLLTFWELLRG